MRGEIKNVVLKAAFRTSNSESDANKVSTYSSWQYE